MVSHFYWPHHLWVSILPKKKSSSPFVVFIISGKIRDAAGSYVACMHALNAIAGVAAALWIVELGYKKLKGRTKTSEGVV